MCQRSADWLCNDWKCTWDGERDDIWSVKLVEKVFFDVLRSVGLLKVSTKNQFTDPVGMLLVGCYTFRVLNKGDFICITESLISRRRHVICLFYKVTIRNPNDMSPF